MTSWRVRPPIDLRMVQAAKLVGSCANRSALLGVRASGKALRKFSPSEPTRHTAVGIKNIFLFEFLPLGTTAAP